MYPLILASVLTSRSVTTDSDSSLHVTTGRVPSLASDSVSLREDSSEPPGLLEQCPFCDYSLRGLPVEHQCPECGEPIDRRCKVFGRRGSWKKIVPIAFFVILVGLILDRGMGPLTVNDVILGAWFVGCVLAFSWPRECYFVLVGPSGLQVGDYSQRKRVSYSWDEVVGVDDDGGKRVIIELEDRYVKVGQYGGLEPSDEAQRCAGYIQACLDHQKNGLDGPANSNGKGDEGV